MPLVRPESKRSRSWSRSCYFQAGVGVGVGAAWNSSTPQPWLKLQHFLLYSTHNVWPVHWQKRSSCCFTLEEWTRNCVFEHFSHFRFPVLSYSNPAHYSAVYHNCYISRDRRSSPKLSFYLVFNSFSFSPQALFSVWTTGRGKTPQWIVR